MISKRGIVGSAFTTLKFCTSEVQILEAIFTSGSDFFFHCGSSSFGNVFIILLENSTSGNEYNFGSRSAKLDRGD